MVKFPIQNIWNMFLFFMWTIQSQHSKISELLQNTIKVYTLFYRRCYTLHALTIVITVIMQN